ncbi:TonB-dependent receptor plug domain-containing protein [Hymenobacter frigidus]|uniref:TonB-dependent receptor plug domain-containing protein n=1 Tax=Hymenobacter frigidus TaxID=1524095 RepID=UPI00166BD271|nr:TonB-dependent receptor plug domain-containing protein [Hymenobacter frigidus]
MSGRNASVLIASTLTNLNLPPFTTIQPALSRVAGVQVTPYSGAPGAWSTVRIRGVANVTGSSQPLYVVDGVPAYNTDVTPEKWDGISYFDRNFFNPNSAHTPHTPTANPLLDIPVEDIATVEVLKGAAATARYGMQGTNGIILITTKRGADGQLAPQPLRVRYAGWGGVQQVRQRYALLNARQFAGIANEAAATNGRPAPYSATDLASLSETDWQDRVFRVAGIQSHNLSVDGLAHRTRYYVAADYLRQTGVVAGSDLSRYQLRANLDQQLTGKLSLGLRASASQTDQRYAGTEFDGGPLLQNALLGIPTGPGRRTTGPLNNPPEPLHELNYYRSTPRTRRLLAQLSATYQFSPELTLTLRGSREQADARKLGYAPKDYLTPVPNVVEIATSTTSQHNWVADAGLRYQHTFAGRHALTATLTYLRQQYERMLEYQMQTRYSSSFFRFEEKSNPIHSPSASFVYTYDGRYEVQGSLRAEVVFAPGSFADNSRFLPGAQLSWHAHKEAFLAGASGLSDLTFWAGAGQTSTFFSPDRTTHHDAGLRLGLLGGRLTLAAAAYQRRTRHAQAALPYTLFSPNGQNLVYLYPDVKLLNQGLELTLGSSWQLGNIRGTTQLAAATNRNEVEDTCLNSFSPFSNALEKGQPLNRFFVYEQDGTYPAGSPDAGQVRFRDRNGDGRAGFGDGYYQGSGLPRYTLGLYQQLRLRRFQLEAQLDGLFGYQILNPMLRYLDDPSGFENSSVRALNYWTPSNQNTSVPRPGSRSSPFLSDQALESGNHVRLSQLTISYDVLPTGPRKISVWAGGQNLFVTGRYRGFDPNVSSGGAAPLQAGRDASVYPVARVWQLGVRAAF